MFYFASEIMYTQKERDITQLRLYGTPMRKLLYESFSRKRATVAFFATNQLLTFKFMK